MLECLRDRPEDVLRFLSRPDVPPTSNDAEHALRPSKIQQNVSGRLTSVARTEDRYRIFGYVATADKHGIDPFTAQGSPSGGLLGSDLRSGSGGQSPAEALALVLTPTDRTDAGEGEPHRCLKGPMPAISRWS
jgi:hypothetical protein